MTTAIITSIEVNYTTALSLRITAKKDLPEYGVKAHDVVYLVYSDTESKAQGKRIYHIVRWDYIRICWACPCKATVANCKHVKAAIEGCKTRKECREMVMVSALGQLGIAIKEAHEKGVQAKERQKHAEEAAKAELIKASAKKTRTTRKREEAALQQRGAFVLPKSYKQIEEEQAARLQSHYVEKLVG